MKGVYYKSKFVIINGVHRPHQIHTPQSCNWGSLRSAALSATSRPIHDAQPPVMRPPLQQKLLNYPPRQKTPPLFRLTSNLRLILLLINPPLNFLYHRVKRRKRQTLPLPNTRFPSVRDTFVDEDRLNVVYAASKHREISLAMRSAFLFSSFPEANARSSLMKGTCGFACDETTPVSSPTRITHDRDQNENRGAHNNNNNTHKSKDASCSIPLCRSISSKSNVSLEIFFFNI